MVVPRSNLKAIHSFIHLFKQHKIFVQWSNDCIWHQVLWLTWYGISPSWCFFFLSMHDIFSIEMLKDFFGYFFSPTNVCTIFVYACLKSSGFCQIVEEKINIDCRWFFFVVVDDVYFFERKNWSEIYVDKHTLLFWF